MYGYQFIKKRTVVNSCFVNVAKLELSFSEFSPFSTCSQAPLQLLHIIADLLAHIVGVGQYSGLLLLQLLSYLLPQLSFNFVKGTNIPCMSLESLRLDAVRENCEFQIVFMGYRFSSQILGFMGSRLFLSILLFSCSLSLLSSALCPLILIN